MKIILSLLLLDLVSCGIEEENPIQVEVITADGETLHSWNGYHWSGSNLNVTVYNKVTNTLYNIPAAVSEWSGLGTPIQPRMTTSSTTAKITVVEGFNPRWLGLATIWLDSSGHIVKGEVKLNTKLLKRYGPAVADHVLCQELGHTLGLDHNHDDIGTCMNDLTAVSNPAPYPNAHDAEELNLIYSHLD
jgi:hypothetical protein